jgi:nitronate monooxygenase
MTFGLGDLAVPIVGAPMAGGPGTPALAAAVSDAGGLGFLAAGYLSADRLAADVTATRATTAGPIGVNLFVPQPSVADTASLDEYARHLGPLARRYGVQLGHPHPDDDGWHQKLEVVSDVAPEAVSFTFGAPGADVLARLRGLGILTLVTVTSEYEAGVALAAGADVLVVQGPAAGGHRGTFAPDVTPGQVLLTDLLAQITAAHQAPIVAAGGLSVAADVDSVLRRGATAAQVGTALLLSDEAGTNAVHRAALQNPQFGGTVVTAAFSGRCARGLENDFVRRFDAAAPLGYPEVNQLTKPIRAAAVVAGDPHGTSLWAGTGFAAARTGGAAQIVAELAVVRT